jgi:spore coat polysaccharide biosynthesis protein SpsF (cytidylyltransferase family)
VPEKFKIEVMLPPERERRADMRLTVDYPEDLILCRRIWEDLKGKAPHIPVKDILAWVDGHPDVASLVKPFVDGKAIWGHVAERAGVPLRGKGKE